MRVVTLKDGQGLELSKVLENLLPQIVEERRHKTAQGLLETLQKPTERAWNNLLLLPEEESLFDFLCKIAWRKPNKGHG